MMNIQYRRGDLTPLLDQLVTDFFRAPRVVVNDAGQPLSRLKIDVLDHGDRYEIRADLPGVRKDDIDVTIDGAHVAIRAQARAEAEPAAGNGNAGRLIHGERTAARFERAFELPAEVTEEGAEARFEDGVLTLRLPRRATVASKRLTVS